MNDSIRSSITALESESVALTERLMAIDTALTALRRLVSPLAEAASIGLPAPTSREPVQAAPVRTPKVRTTLGKHPSEDREQRLLAALGAEDGLSSGELGQWIGEHTDRAKFSLAQMAKKGLIHRTGTGPRNYQWHLGAARAAGVPAKEIGLLLLAVLYDALTNRRVRQRGRQPTGIKPDPPPAPPRRSTT